MASSPPSKISSLSGPNPTMPFADYAQLLKALCLKIFDPFNDQEPVSPTISDDLEDIYCDVKEGLLAMESSGAVSQNVVWEWKFGLEIHWGRHAVGAIAALHSLVSSE
jgi:hypothetical protein